LKQAIQERARQLDFDVCRFTTAAPPARKTNFESGWRRNGMARWPTWLARFRNGQNPGR